MAGGKRLKVRREATSSGTRDDSPGVGQAPPPEPLSDRLDRGAASGAVPGPSRQPSTTYNSAQDDALPASFQEGTPPGFARCGPYFEGVLEAAEGSPKGDLVEDPGSVASRRVRRRLTLTDLGSSQAASGAAVSGRGGAPGGRGQRGGARGGGRPPSDAGVSGDAPRWCKPLYVPDSGKGSGKGGAPLRASARSGQAADKGKIICRLCGSYISFASSSYTAAARHVGTHSVTRENMEVALAFAAKAEDAGATFPMKEWKEHLEAGSGKRRVYTYMHQTAHEAGTSAWTHQRDAIARWVASDTMALSVVESKAFRRMCASLNGRCPGFSRKTIATRVS